ncbi:hypothetical protein GobsT_14030 [Gemmata obscuriglobus]|uniref:Uncharacterized protein n=1 Tax=Gemmata obscuriglobus TaxID=114 RepID=A0A2Z3HFK2_9BACT|nr:hypothetical protein [Gemmata obscuriglobus]AWM40160.1 hypothetical protein C1280_26255 [Gemmata obscuriglobus]QEG26658.1 hypothetical protein GobsT_14030 [Gemmata obscuriglobus]VTS02262.1 unnamed protein product [Gemmata obscuriglobus UQM 2246]
MTATHVPHHRLIPEAIRLGLRVRVLHRALDADPTLEGPNGAGNELDRVELLRLGMQLYGIVEVLQLLGQTPNAYMNAEAMDVLRAVVQEAAALEREPWAAAILERAAGTPPSLGDVNV